MGTVLYEAQFQLERGALIPVCLLVVIIFFPKIFSNKEMSKTGKLVVRTLRVFAGILVSGVILLETIMQVNMYNGIIGAYHRGEYEIVEGYVENFDPMPYSGHAVESFEINGIYFSYSDYTARQGYHNAKSHGGVISGNGQYLKIGYVQYYFNSENQNVIVYIEELTSPK